MRLARSLIAAFALVALSNCGASYAPFASGRPESTAAELTRFLPSGGNEPRRSNGAVILVGACTVGSAQTAEEESARTRRTCARSIRAVGPGGEPRWSFDVEVRGSPIVTSNAFVLEEARGTTVRALGDGRVLFVEPPIAGARLAGADDDGDVLALTFSVERSSGTRSRLIVLREGVETYRLDLPNPIGHPAVRGGRIALPWGTQFMSILRADAPVEEARIRLREDVVSTAMRGADGEILFGNANTIYSLTSEIAGGMRADGSAVTLDTQNLPGRPKLLPDGYAPQPSIDSASHKVRIAWAPRREGSRVAFGDNVAYLVFFRVVFAFDLTTSGMRPGAPLDLAEQRVRWVVNLDQDAVGAEAVLGGLWIARADGTLEFYDEASGTKTNSITASNSALAAAFVSIGTTPSSQAGLGPALPPLRDQLLGVAQITDSRMVPARVLATQKLAALTDETAARNLVDLCQDTRAPNEVRRAACEAVATRDGNTDALIAALEQHAEFLAGTRVPPVGALARGTARAHDARAVAFLVPHIHDPNTPVEDLPALFTALKDLGDRSATTPIEDFVRLYHAEAVDVSMSRALTAAMDALVGLMGTAAGDVLNEVIGDPLAPAAARSYATQQLERLTAANSENPPPENTAGTEPNNVEPIADDPESRIPVHLTAEIVAAAFAPVREQIATCIRSAAGHPASARLVLFSGGDGTVRLLSVAPERLESCIGPLVATRRMPVTRSGRPQQIIYSLRP